MGLLASALNNTPKKEKERSGFMKFANALASPFKAASDALFKPVVESLAKPVGEVVASANELVGKEAPEWTKDTRLASPEHLALLRTGGVGEDYQRVKAGLENEGYKGAGFTDVLNVASIAPAGAVSRFAPKVLSQGGGIFSRAARVTSSTLPAVAQGQASVGRAILQGAKQAVPAGAAWGGAYGLAGAVDDEASFGEAAMRTAMGAGVGAATGAGIAAIGAGIGGLLNRGKQAINKDFRARAIVQSNKEGLKRLEDANAPVRKIIAREKARGLDPVDMVANSDLLVNSVDADGKLRTAQEGGAISQVQDFLKGQEDVVRNNLVREGKAVNITAIEGRLRDAIDNSGLEGEALETAHRKITKTLKGLQRRASKEGDIPLVKIHDAKVDKYRTIDYTNEGTKAADKAIAKAFKSIVEDETVSVDIKAINRELARYYSVISLLERLDGKTVRGGRLGKYFSQTIGAIVGSQFGPFGAIIGAELGGLVRGSQMQKNFSASMGRSLDPSAILDDAVRVSNSPRALPAPAKTKPVLRLTDQTNRQ